MADKANVSALSNASTTANAVQTNSSTTSAANVSASSNVDTKVRTAGASLSEFLANLEDYTPTVGYRKIRIFNIFVFELTISKCVL